MITRILPLLLAAALLLAVPQPALAQLGNPTGGSTRGDLGAGTLLLGWGGAGAESLRTRSVTLTNAQMLDLDTTPVTIIPDPGDGYVASVLRVELLFDYTGAYTGGSDLRLYYINRTSASGTAASGLLTTTSCVVGVSADTVCSAGGAPDGTTLRQSEAIVLQNSTTTEFGGGNASNSVRIRVIYRLLQIP